MSRLSVSSNHQTQTDTLRKQEKQKRERNVSIMLLHSFLPHRNQFFNSHWRFHVSTRVINYVRTSVRAWRVVSEASTAFIRQEIQHYSTDDDDDNNNNTAVTSGQMELHLALHSTIQNKIIHQPYSHDCPDDDHHHHHHHNNNNDNNTNNDDDSDDHIDPDR